MIVPNLREEKRLWKAGARVLVGVDEVGRGALAGPVVAAAVSARSPEDLESFLRDARTRGFRVRDSKALLPHQREGVFWLLKAHPRLRVRMCGAGPGAIDRINIRKATLHAFRGAVSRLPGKPSLLLVDGVDFVPVALPQYTYIRGDARIALISLASICAKVYRDKLMVRLSKRYPKYGFAAHKGYGTPAHKSAIRKYGPSPVHRRTFL